MAVQVRKGGVWQTITGAQVFANGAWRALVAIQIFANGAWRQVGNFTTPAGGGAAITVSLTDPGLSTVGPSSTLTSAAMHATPSGGVAPYSYAWSIVSADPGPTFTINSPALASTTVTAASIGPIGSNVACTIKCVVTDSLGNTGTSANADMSFQHSSS
jgi:hypothetical protein